MAFPRKRTRYGQRGGKLPPWAIVAICAAAAILLTILVGNLLRLWLDDETYHKLTAPETTAQTTAPRPDAAVPHVRAYPYLLTDSVEDAVAKGALSFSINRSDGTLNYTSPVAEYQGRAAASNTSLADRIGPISAFGIHISGVFYPRALTQTDPDLRYAETVEEAALLREFLQAGGTDVLLMDLPFSSMTGEGILTYVECIKTMLGAGTVGVAVPLSIAESEGGARLLEQLLGICDFCALDMTDAVVTSPETDDLGISLQVKDALLHIDFFLEEYDMRLLISQTQSLWITAVEIKLVKNYQIVSSKIYFD